MEDRIALVCLILAFVVIAFSLISMFRTLYKEYKVREQEMASAVDYAKMCTRIEPVENDVRTNSGDHFEEEVYLNRADSMNQNTQILAWINSELK